MLRHAGPGQLLLPIVWRHCYNNKADALQDLIVHRGEVHNKLVGIMRERLIASLKQLPALVATWNLCGDSPQPSPFSQNLIKQLRTLSVVWPFQVQTKLREGR